MNKTFKIIVEVGWDNKNHEPMYDSILVTGDHFAIVDNNLIVYNNGDAVYAVAENQWKSIIENNE